MITIHGSYTFTRPKWHLSIEDKKDFIELPVDEVFDIKGYDVRNMLRLFRSSNSKIYEWIQSPVMYRENEGRPVLAALWIVQHNACPPMEFSHLRQLVTDENINNRIDALLEKKQAWTKNT